MFGTEAKPELLWRPGAFEGQGSSERTVLGPPPGIATAEAADEGNAQA